MSEVTPFNFEGHEVRVIAIDGEPWWVVNDVCAVLGISDSRTTVQRLDEDDVGQTRITDNLGREQLTNIVNEPGLYDLIIRSDKPRAKPFRRWIIAEVLPSIRKTGSYSVDPGKSVDDLDIIQSMIDRARADRARIAAVEDRQRIVEAKVEATEGGYDEFTALAYAKRHGLPTDLVSAQRHGTRASKLMKSRGREPRKVDSALFGTVNVYPVDVLDETAEQLS